VIAEGKPRFCGKVLVDIRIRPAWDWPAARYRPRGHPEAGRISVKTVPGHRADWSLGWLAWLVAEPASVRESIASTTWSRGCLASMGITPNARKRP
jgi:hypothetical protein